jgi:hypothetical protein
MAVKDVLLAMEKIGFTTTVLPFIIVFTVVFAVLQRSKVLGIDKNGNPKANYNAMVAFVIAFFSLIMFQMLDVMSWFIKFGVLMLVAFVFIGITLSVIGGRVHLSGALKAIAFALVLFVLFEALVMAGVLDEHTAYTMVLPLLVAVLIGGGAIAYMSGGKEKTQEKAKEKLKKQDEIPGIEKVGEIKQKSG